MKLEEGDLVRIRKDLHPWRKKKRNINYKDKQGRVGKVIYAPPSKLNPTGVFVYVRVGSVWQPFPRHYLIKLKDKGLTISEECVNE